MLRWIVAAISLWMAYLLREKFTPFIIGAVIAYLLAVPVGMLTRRTGMHRAFSVLIIYVLTIGGLSYAIYKGQPYIAEEAKSLFANRQEILENAVAQISRITGWTPDISDVSGQVLEKIKDFITAKPEELLAFGGKISHGLLSVLICLISSIYMLYDGKKIGRFFLRFVPQSEQAHWLDVAREINTKFGRYIAGQMILVALTTVLAFILLLCFGVKYALLLAILIGVLEIVPVIGPLVALSLAMVVTSSQLGLSTALTVTGILWVFRIVEDYLVIPRIIGHAVQLHPLVTIFSVLAGEHLAGGLGMLLAVPAAAAIKVVLDRSHPEDNAGESDTPLPVLDLETEILTDPPTPPATLPQALPTVPRAPRKPRYNTVGHRSSLAEILVKQGALTVEQVDSAYLHQVEEFAAGRPVPDLIYILQLREQVTGDALDSAHLHLERLNYEHHRQEEEDRARRRDAEYERERMASFGYGGFGYGDFCCGPR